MSRSWASEPTSGSPVHEIVYASHGGPTGYGTAARRAAAALRLVGAQVEWVSVEHRQRGDAASEPSPSSPLPSPWIPVDAVSGHPLSSDLVPDGRTLVAHLPPDHAATTRWMVEHLRCVLHTVWETGTFPEHWRPWLNADETDGLIVPTRWNLEMLRRSGISIPVTVVPHSVDSDANKLAPLPASLAGIRDETFVFAIVSAWTERKDVERTVRSYLDAFDGSDDVLLVVKTTPARDHLVPYGSPARWATWYQLAAVLSEYRNPAPILLVADTWTDDDVRALLHRLDCCVCLPHAEGWGLWPFDSAVAGKPVITTGWGGPLEYMGADYPGLVAVDMVPATMGGAVFGEWASADRAHAVELMRGVFRDRGATFRIETERVAERLRSECSPLRVGELLHRVCRPS